MREILAREVGVCIGQDQPNELNETNRWNQYIGSDFLGFRVEFKPNRLRSNAN